MLAPINRMTASQSKLTVKPNKLVLKSVPRMDGCRVYWTRSKNHLAIKLKDKIELVNICDIRITGVPMDLVYCKKSLWHRTLSMLSLRNLCKGRLIEGRG